MAPVTWRLRRFLKGTLIVLQTQVTIPPILQCLMLRQEENTFDQDWPARIALASVIISRDDVRHVLEVSGVHVVVRQIFVHSRR